MKNIKIALLLIAIVCITYNANAQIEIEAGTKTYSEVFDSLRGWAYTKPHTLCCIV